TGLAVSSTDLFVLLNPGSVVDFSLATDPPQQFGNPIAVGSAFGGMAITPGTPQQLWVATGAVTVIATATFSPLTQFIPEQIHDPNVYNFAVGVAISSDPQNPTAYVTYDTYDYSPIRFSASGGIAVVCVNTQVVNTVVPLFSLPGPIALSADGKI